MLKQLSLAFSAFISLSSPTLALPEGVPFAIAPGFSQLNACQEFTANKYHLLSDQVQPSLGKRTSQGYFVNWRVAQYRASGYCFVTNNNAVADWAVSKGSKPGEFSDLGPNDKVFQGLPNYGAVVVNRGQAASKDRQYFLLRPMNSNQSYRWYARCANNADQVYDHRGKYVGYDRRMTVMFNYVCEFSPLTGSNRPSGRPEPR